MSLLSSISNGNSGLTVRGILNSVTSLLNGTGTAASTLDGTEKVPGVQAGSNVDITTQAIADLAFTGTGLSGLSAASALDGTEIYYAVQGSSDVKVAGSQIAALAKLRSVNAQTGTSYTIVAGDVGKLVTFSNASAVAVSLPQATGSFGASSVIMVENKGAGTVTITPATSTIDGASSLALTQNQGVILVSDGTNYTTMRGMGGGSGSTFTSGDGTFTFTDGSNSSTFNVLSSSRILFAGITYAPTFAADVFTDKNNGDVGWSRGGANVIAFGNGSAGDASATIKAKTVAGSPSTSDVPAGTWALIRDTTNSTTKLYYNNAGSLQNVALA